MPSPPSHTPEASPSPLVAASPNPLMLGTPLTKNHHHYRLTLISGIGVAVTAAAVMMLVVLVFLIHRKSRELEGSEKLDKTSSKAFPSSWPVRKFQEGLALDLLQSHSLLALLMPYVRNPLILFFLWGVGSGGGIWG